MHARPPLAVARGGMGRSRRLFRSGRRGCLLGRRRSPGRYHVRRGRCRGRSDGGRENGHCDRPLCWKAVSPRCGANAWIQALGAIRGRASGLHMHDLHGPAADGSVMTRNVQRSRRFVGSGLSSLERAKTHSMLSIDVQYCEVKRHFDAAEMLGGRSTFRTTARLRERSTYCLSAPGFEKQYRNSTA